MTTYRIGMPSELKRQLQCVLARQCGRTPIVRVTPRDRAERKCAAYDADHYEVQAYYYAMSDDPDSLAPLEKALRELPGVYITTQVRGQRRNEVTNPEWPAALGSSRRGFHELRPQAIALIRD